MNKISKIQFRQDSLVNFTNDNPILAQGEPALIIDTREFKIGDGQTPFNSLGSFAQAAAGINDVPDTNDLYVRKREPNESTGTWVSISEKYNRLTLADLLNTDYETEVDMHYDIKLHDGSIKRVYGQRFYFEVNKNGGEPDSRAILSNVNKIIDFGGSIKTDSDHEYIITSEGINYSVSAYIDNEQHSNALYIYSICDETREDAPIDIWVLYTKI